MKNESYFETQYGRVNIAKKWIFALLTIVVNYPAHIHDVMFRRGFGERYVNYGSILTAQCKYQGGLGFLLG